MLFLFLNFLAVTGCLAGQAVSYVLSLQEMITLYFIGGM